jgi:hypothetical protein
MYNSSPSLSHPNQSSSWYFEWLVHRGTRRGTKHAYIKKLFCSSRPLLELLVLSVGDPWNSSITRVGTPWWGVTEVCLSHQDLVLHQDGSQHTANVSTHLVFLLRQARGCCGPIRSSRDPHGAGQYMLTPTDAVHSPLTYPVNIVRVCSCCFLKEIRGIQVSSLVGKEGMVGRGSRKK